MVNRTDEAKPAAWKPVVVVIVLMLAIPTVMLLAFAHLPETHGLIPFAP